MEKSILYIGLSMMILSFTSLANESQNNIYGAVTGPYIGLNTGSAGMNWGNLSSNSQSQVSYKDHHDGGFGTRIYIGYLWNIPRVSGLKLGTELGYIYSNKSTFQLNEQKWVYNGYNIDLLGVARYNFAESKIYLLGKLGVMLTHQTVDMTGYGSPVSSAKNRPLPEIGFGLGYDFTRHLEANLILTYAPGKKAEPPLYGSTSLNGSANVVPVETLTLGVAYHF
jgi:hypothetical protein